MITLDDSNGERVEAALRVLDWEIDRAIADQTRPGWTPWVLLASLAAVVGLIFQNDVRSLSFWSCMVVAAAGGITLDIVQTLAVLLKPPLAQTDDLPRYRTMRSHAGGDRAAQLLLLAKNVFIIVILLRAGSVGIRFAAAGWALAPYGFFVVSGLIVFLLGFSDFPLRASVEANWKTFLPQFLLFVILAVVLSCIVSGAIAHPWFYSPPEVRTGVLLAVAYQLFHMLLSDSSGSPLVGSLVEIRRALAFARVDASTALEEAETIVRGMAIDRVLQGRVNQILLGFERARSLVEEAHSAVPRLELDRNGAEDDRAKKENLEKARSEWALRIDAMKRLNAIHREQIDSLSTFSAAVHRDRSDAASRVRQLLQDLNARQERLEQDVAALHARVAL